MSADASMTTDLSWEDWKASMEAKHPGFAAHCDEARAELYAKYPDPAQRRRFILSHFIRVEADSGE